MTSQKIEISEMVRELFLWFFKNLWVDIESIKQDVLKEQMLS